MCSLLLPEPYPGVLALFRMLDVGVTKFRGVLIQDRASVCPRMPPVSTAQCCAMWCR